MLAVTAMTTLCTVAVAFYVRFLVALWKECRHIGICYLVRLQYDSDEDLIPETPRVDTSFPRAA